MKFSLQISLLKTSMVLVSLSARNRIISANNNLRGNTVSSDSGIHRYLKKETTGAFLLAEIEDEDEGTRKLQNANGRPKQTMNVELPDGTIYELTNLPPGFDAKGLNSGITSVTLPAGTQLLSNGRVNMRGKAPVVLNRIFERRQLAVKEGDKTVLAVLVNTMNGFTTVEEDFVSDSVFGNGVDTVNLASQYEACSHGKLTFVKAADRIGLNETNIANGVVTVNLPAVNATEGSGVVRNAVTAELNAIFGVSSPKELANHVMYCLPAESMSGIAYAYINSWNSVYKDHWCTYVSGQMHEIGHNLNFAHSNENGGYKDQSGMMGYSYGKSDTSMCFNGAKSWQSGWYVDKEITIGSAVGSTACFNGILHGVVDYSNATTVLLKVEDDAGLNDYYVNFNAKKGFNFETKEGGNQVTITSKVHDVRDKYAASELIAKLGTGETFTFANYTINVGAIDEVAGTAEVIVLPSNEAYCPETTSSPTFSPTLSTMPSSQPSHTPTMSPIDLVDFADVGNNGSPSSSFPLGRCEGDCDFHSECQEGLMCYQRSGTEPVPGCRGEGTSGKDYCAERPSPNFLWRSGNNGSPAADFPLGLCEGDCDSDAECAGDLKCFQRGGTEAVPGCVGLPGVGGEDYCYDPNAV